MRQSPSQKSLANIAKFLVKMKRTILAMILALYCIVSFAQQKSKSKIDKTPKKVVPTTPKTSTSDNNAPLTWHTDVMKADSISKKTNRPIFGFFTGSDWCGWCHKLQREVFAKKEFISWANNNVVLLELDFPRRKQLSPELQQQNNSLAQAFQISGYPTVWLFTIIKDSANANNVRLNAFGSLGYPSGATEGKEEVKFLENANAILAKRK